MHSNISRKIGLLTFLTIFALFAFPLLSSGQATPDDPRTTRPQPAPFDFVDNFYLANGIDPKYLSDRPADARGYSVIDNSKDPRHSEIRILATLGAYTQYGDPVFWYPLGRMSSAGFTNDTRGIEAQALARRYPVYVFPDRFVQERGSIATWRHAPLFENGRELSTKNANPLGLREIFVVTYTEKALGREGGKMMAFFIEKNGRATDNTAIIRTMDDLRFLSETGFVTIEPVARPMSDLAPRAEGYLLGPMISDPRNGFIRKDAFLLLATKDGLPLPAEEPFANNFQCLQATGEWCLYPSDRTYISGR